MKYIKYIILAIMLFGMLNTISAQTIMDNSVSHSRVYIRIGIEPTTMGTLGYQHNFKIGFLKHNLATYAEWKVSLYRFSFKNSEIKIGGIIPVYEKGSFKIINNLNFSAGSVATHNFNSKKFAVGDEIASGIYKKSWFIATTIEYDKIYLNHIEHTDFYRLTYYEDAKDGWYKGGGGMFQFGLQGGGTIKEKYDIHIEAKLPFTEKFNSYGGSPLHVNLGLGYRF